MSLIIAPETGSKKLICVALKWTDKASADLESVKNCGLETKNNFKRLSKNQFNFTSMNAYTIDVPFAATPDNVDKAVSNAKEQLATKGIKQDGSLTYAFITNNVGSGSHSSGDTSIILNTLTTTFYHELGRTKPIDLGSSGAFIKDVYEDQADGTTFMSHFASNNLTASQLYYLGWLGLTQVVSYDPSTGSKEFTIYDLGSAIGTDNLMTVMVIDGSNKPLFVSRPTFTDGSINWTIHKASSGMVAGNNRGSERIAVFSKTITYQGLVFTELSSAILDTATISISPA